MKAIHFAKYGPPEVLKLKELEKPMVGADEILIKVYAATVNCTDCAILRAKPLIMRLFTGLFKPNKNITGTDFAGIIEAIGENVKNYQVGDKVFGFDDMGLCSHAQYMKISANNALSTMPENISFEQAAASTEGAHYAYNMVNKVELKVGSKVLINGATGAIGSAAVQLLKYFGANVTAVCNSKNMELVKSIGADKVIDYTNEDFTKSDQKYQYIFDAAGKSTFSKCKPLLENSGVYISTELGWMAQNLFYALFTPLFGGKKVKFPYPHNILRSIQLIKKLMEEKKFMPVIDRTYPLEDIAEAFGYVNSGQKTGNVVISIDHENK